MLLLCKDRQPSPVYDKAVVEMTSKYIQCILVENLTISEQKVTFREEKKEMLLTYVCTYITSHSLNPAYILNIDQCMLSVSCPTGKNVDIHVTRQKLSTYSTGHHHCHTYVSEALLHVVLYTAKACGDYAQNH